MEVARALEAVPADLEDTNIKLSRREEEMETMLELLDTRNI